MKRVLNSKFEYPVFTCVLFLVVFGLLILYSASSMYAGRTYGSSTYLFVKQSIFCIAGIIIALSLSFINYKIYIKFSDIIFVVCFVLVIITAFAGRISRGTSRWIEVRGLIFQPSELMKLAMIIHLSKVLKSTVGEFDKKEKFLKVMMIAYIPTFIVALSNLSTGIILFLIATFMIFLVSTKKMIFLVLIGMVVAFYFFAFPVAKVLYNVGLLKQYQVGRIFAWKDPTEYSDIAYQTMQGLYSIGSGKLTGRGYMSSIQKAIIPEVHNDMIFCVLCEEIGFIGAVGFIVLYIILIFRIIFIAFRQEDIETLLITFGIGLHIAIQVILNIGVATNLLPNTGVTLPFISYGGSSLIVLFIEIGIVMSIVRYSDLR